MAPSFDLLDDLLSSDLVDLLDLIDLLDFADFPSFVDLLLPFPDEVPPVLVLEVYDPSFFLTAAAEPVVTEPLRRLLVEVRLYQDSSSSLFTYSISSSLT